MVRIDGVRAEIETKTLLAVFDGGILTELVDKGTGRVLIRTSAAAAPPPLELVFSGGEASALTGAPGDLVTCRAVGPATAEFRFEGWNGDGILLVTEDRGTGEIVVEPSGYSSRTGLRSCRWNVTGISPALELAAPFYQGVKLPLDSRFIAGTRWEWPHSWEAGIVILQGRDGGFRVSCIDDRYRYKTLTIGAGQPPVLGFETEAYGPLTDVRGAGGLPWRIAPHTGDWTVPAAEYRDRLIRTFGVEPTARPGWIADVRLALSWCPTDPGILDALAERIDPRTVLLHIPNWRSDPYDENYPTFEPSDAGKAFIAKARKMGFRAMPHGNSIDMDPTHPSYRYLRDFEYRHPESKRIQGWTWTGSGILPVQESNAARLRHRDKKTMVKIHPGLAMWRSILAENLGNAIRELDLEALFIDVTLNTWNLHNCLVENVTPTEGMRKLTRHLAAVRDGIAIGGEGRNEITSLDQSFAQVHLFKSHHASMDGLASLTGIPLDEYLFGGFCRSFGYSRLGGADADQEVRMRLHEIQGAIPTITVGSAKEIIDPNPVVDTLISTAVG